MLQSKIGPCGLANSGTDGRMVKNSTRQVLATFAIVQRSLRTQFLCLSRARETVKNASSK
jgi:hypothetical protein